MTRRSMAAPDLELARGRLRSETKVLESVRARLHRFAVELDEATTEAARFRAAPSSGVVTFMVDAAVCTADDTLRPAIAQLRRAAAVTPEELAEISESTHAESRRSHPPSVPRAGHGRKESRDA